VLTCLLQQKNKAADLETRVQKETERQIKLKESIEQSKAGREDSQERELLLKKLKEQKKLNQELNVELQKYQDNDPILYEAKGKLAL
jgi:hypothetical protein